MNELDRKALESRLVRLSYEVIGGELRTLSSGDLLDLLDSRSTKIGDTAAGFLASRGEAALLIGALLSDRIRTALGRVRAGNMLGCFGLSAPGAVMARVHMLADRSDDVVDTALFGIVLSRRKDLLPKLRDHLARLSPGTRRCDLFIEAIKALEANDPSLFSPDFFDIGNVWRLDEPAPPYQPNEL